MYKHCPVITALSGFLVLIIGVLCTWYGFPKIIDHEISKQIALHPGTKAFEVWQKQPFPLLFKVYIFHVTNPDAVMIGEKPILKEMGPYIYDIEVERTKAEINEKDDTIKYYLKKTFHFNKKLSGCRSEEDKVTILNAALMGMILQVQTMLPSALTMVKDAYPFIYPDSKDVFLRTTIGELLFGGITLFCSAPEIDFFCSTMKGFLPQTVEVAENDRDFIFSMFRFMNNTAVGPYIMERGMKPNSTRGELISFLDEPSLDVWNGDGCNMLNGSDSGMYFTMKKPVEKIYTFTADICRSVFVKYEKPVTFEGIKAFKYSARKESLSKTSDNMCFCPSNDEGSYVCPPDGLVDLSPCIKAPVLLSFPHFLYADKTLIEFAKGLNPDKNNHESYLIIEPMTATPLTGAKRVQMSMILKSIEEIPLLANVTQGVFPILWLDEFVIIPDDFISFMKSNFKKMGLLDVVKWIFITTGIILMVISFLLVMHQESLMCFSNRGKVSISNVEPFQVQSNRDSSAIALNDPVKRPSLYPQVENRNLNMSFINKNQHNQGEVWQFKL
ncbi:sensory neuron membrane protein 2-like [Onthophagus taurus]|uniref:sensory neuron membrane protein 2-like n=1 Tax=Onthophagus taurus TaxID=166361 RepID=UPI0039BE9260